MPHKILIVDDEPNLLNVVQLMLKLAGYETFTARDGVECLEVLNQQPVDLIILDVMMPEMDGWEVLRQMNRLGLANRIPVMLLTAKVQPIDKVLALKVFGVRVYVTKPFEKADLLRRVAEILG